MESTGADLGCRCEEGFDEIDVPGVTKDGQAVTVCCGMENINLIIVQKFDVDPYMVLNKCSFHLKTLQVLIVIE